MGPSATTRHATRLATLLFLTGAVPLVCEARSIRVDPGEFDPNTGFSMWEQNFNNVLDDQGDTGQVTLPFTFFGASTLFVSSHGVVSFGSPINAIADFSGASTPYLAPLFLTDLGSSVEISFDWGGQSRNCNPAPGDCGPDGESSGDPLQDLVEIDTEETAFADAAFRVTWRVRDAQGGLLTATQLAVWQLLDGNYVVEFNYDRVGFDPANSFAGFDLGSGLSFDASGVSDYIDLAACIDDNTGCAAGDNYVAPGFPTGTLRDAFLTPIFGDPISGRAIFYFAGSGTQVPEPGSLALVLAGLGLVAATRRRHPARAA